jgi:hypothetical protein
MCQRRLSTAAAPNLLLSTAAVAAMITRPICSIPFLHAVACKLLTTLLLLLLLLLPPAR